MSSSRHMQEKLWELGPLREVHTRCYAKGTSVALGLAQSTILRLFAVKVATKGKQATPDSTTTTYCKLLLRWQAVDLTQPRLLQLNVRKPHQVQTWIQEQILTSRTCMKKHPLRMATVMATAEAEIGQPVCPRARVLQTSQGIRQLPRWQRRWKMGRIIRSAESHSPSSISTS